MKYPEFACQCCGITNADMYYDWYKEKTGHKPNKAAWATFQAYRGLQEELKKLKEENETTK